MVRWVDIWQANIDKIDFQKGIPSILNSKIYFKSFFWFFLMPVWMKKDRKETMNDLMVANDLLVAILNKELFQNVTPKYASIQQ